MSPQDSYPNAPRPDTYEAGMEFQDWVCMRLAKYSIILQNLSSKKYQYSVGENLQGFEIKFDSWCSKSGRLSIEIAEKRRASNRQWVPSGIFREDNSWLYIQGNYDILFVFPKNSLRRYFRQKKPCVKEEHGTVRAFYVPFEAARIIACKTIEVSG